MLGLGNYIPIQNPKIDFFISRYFIFLKFYSPLCLNCFRHLLKEHSKILGERHPARRQNLVAILKNSHPKTSKTESGIVVGFCSLYFMDEGRIVVKMAFRVASQLRGQGTVFNFANFTLTLPCSEN